MSALLFELPIPANGADASVSRYAKSGAREKVLGAVYTPARVAAVMTRWAVRAATDRVLDPSCGEGVFLAAAHTRLGDLGARGRPAVQGVDIEAETAAAVGAECADFFSWAPTSPKVDVILGNPPYIRSHLFNENSRQLAFAQLKPLGIKSSRLMSTWAPFLAISAGLLLPGGRLAMVIPEELLTVGYAEPIRAFLLRRFFRVIVCFPEPGLFPGVQQATVLLLCENTAPQGRGGLHTLSFAALERGDGNAVEAAPPWNWCDKWSHLFLDQAQRTAISAAQATIQTKALAEYGRVEVGVVTGENRFFLLDQERAERVGTQHLCPVVSSARDLQGLRFSAEDCAKATSGGRPTWLLNPSGPPSRFGVGLRDYLAQGEREGVNRRYKCSIREPWYRIPSMRPVHAVMFRQAGDAPRIIALDTPCDATDTVHRITWHSPQFGLRHAVAFLNTWTLIYAELTGRSYGGGVLELMPSEANGLPLPAPLAAFDALLEPIDRLLRARQVNAAVTAVDAVALASLPAGLLREMRAALRTLVDRRKNRS